MQARYITTEDAIKAGDTLLDKHPNYPTVTRVLVTKVTKTQIVTQYSRYTKEGAMIGDEYRRRRLYIQAQEKDSKA